MPGLNLQPLTYGTDGSPLPPEHTLIAAKLGSNSKQLTAASDGSLNVTIVGGAGSGGTAMTDDAAFTVGTTSVTPVAGTYKSTRDSVDDNDAGAFAMTAKRGLYTTLETPAGDTAMDEVNDAVRVNIVAGSSSGTQYTEGDTDASITGTAIMWEDGSDTLRAVSAAKPLPVSVTGGGDATAANQTTQITAEQAIQASVELIDDSVATLGTTTYTEAANKALTVAAVRRDADTTLVNSTNELAPLQVDARGALKVEVFSGEALPVTLTSTTVTGTVAVTQSGTWDEVGINDSGNSITVDNGGTFAVQVDGAALTSLQLLDDVIATLGTTTYTEAATKGAIMGAVRRDADTTLVDTTNEVAPLIVDARGLLKVEAFSGETLPVSLSSVPSHAVTNAGTFAVQVDGNALTSLQLIDDVVYTDDTSTHATGTSKGMGIMAVATPTDAAVDANDIGMVAMTTSRLLKVDASGVAVPITDNASSITVDYATTGSGTATGAIRVELPTNGTGVIATVGAVTAITNALPAGTNAIGKLAANSGVDIGDVDVTSIIPGTGATNLGKAEDGPHTTGDVGVMGLAVRRDTASALGADNDYTPLITNARAATWVAIEDGAGGQITSFGGGTQYTEDAAAAANPVGTTPILVRKDTPAGEVTTDGDNIAQRGTNYGAAYVTLLDTSGNAVAVGGGTQYTEDVAAAADPIGTALIGVRADALAAVTTTDGDNIAARMTNKGELYVKHVDSIPVTQSGTWDEVGINDSGNSITVDNGGTFAVQVDGAALTSLQLIDDVIATLGTTTYTEAATKGAIIGAVRRDADTTLVDTTNEVGPLQMDANGRLKVEAFSGETLPVSLASVPSHAVTNAGTFAVQVDGAALTSLQLADDVVYTDDTSTHATGTSKGTGIMAVANPTDAAVDANDIGMVAMTLARALKNDITTIAGTAPTTVGKLDVKGADGDVFVRQATASNLNMTEASAASILTSVQLIDDGVYTDDTSTHATGTSKGYGIMAAATPTDTAVNANDIGMVGMTNNRELYMSLRDIAGTTAVSGSGTATGALRVELANNGTGVLSTVSTVTTVSTLTGGGIAHDSGDSGNPVKVGARALASPKGATLVANADRTDLISDTDGAVLVKSWTAGGDRISERISNTDGASTAFTNFSAVASTFNNITDVTIHNSHASTNCYVDLRDGTAGSVLWTFPAPATGGVTHHFDPPLKQTTAATALAYDVSAAVSTVYISVNGFQSKV